MIHIEKLHLEYRGDIMNIVEMALNKNEMKFLLEGEKGYKLENDSWASISAPIDWTRVIPLIYKEYENNKNVEKMYFKAISEMFEGEAEETYFGMAILYFQIMREESNRSPFKINRTYFIDLATEAINKNKKCLKLIKKWGGNNSSEGLWSEVQRYRKLFQTRFKIEI